jgi:IclR family transcriptional regulator, pca regulon regulatory protein
MEKDKPQALSSRRSKALRSGSLNGDFVKSLERGLKVIQAFGISRERLSLSDVAKLTGMTRAAARRYLLSLEALRFVSSDGRFFRLEPHVLSLGYAYLASLDWLEFTQPILRDMGSRLNENCSVSVLDGAEIVYVARVQTSRIISINLTVGTRLPAAVTSMGRVLLAALEPGDLDRVLAASSMRRYTESTVTEVEELKRILQTVRDQKYAYVDQELENGLRSIAVPVIGAGGKTVAAANIAAHAMRVKKADMIGPYLDALLETAAKISQQSSIRPL